MIQWFLHIKALNVINTILGLVYGLFLILYLVLRIGDDMVKDANCKHSPFLLT